MRPCREACVRGRAVTGRAWRGVALGASVAVHALAVLAFLGGGRTTPVVPEGGTVALVWGEGEQGAAGAPAEPGAGATSEPAPADPVPADPEPPAALAEAPERVPEPEPLSPEEPSLAGEEVPPPPPPAPPRPRMASRAPSHAALQAPERSEAGQGAPAASAAVAQPGVGGAALSSGAVVPPRPLATPQNPPPTYPAMSRRNGEQGRVTLRVSVDTEGRVLGLEVVETSGHLALDEAARRAVRDWRFQPAMQDGRPVLASARVGITFRLEGDRPW